MEELEMISRNQAQNTHTLELDMTGAGFLQLFWKLQTCFTFWLFGCESCWCPGAGQEVEDFNGDGDQGKVDEGLRHLHQVCHLPIANYTRCFSGSSNVTNVTHVQTTGSSNFRNKTLQILRKYKHRKLTENKFKPGVARPELVEDWDQVKFQQLQMFPKNTN